MKTIFTSDWKDWITSNVNAGKDRDGIFKILLDEGYEYSAIVSEMDYRPSRPPEEIENPFKTNKTHAPAQKYESNHGLPISKEQIYIPNGMAMDSDEIDIRLVDGFLNAHELSLIHI